MNKSSLLKMLNLTLKSEMSSYPNSQKPLTRRMAIKGKDEDKNLKYGDKRDKRNRETAVERRTKVR